MRPLVPRSDIQGVRWPAFPSEEGSLLLALLDQFEESQWWAPDRLRERQDRQIEALLAHAAATVPFYRDRIDAGEPLTEARWRAIPFLTRRDLQDHADALLSERPPASHGILSRGGTSGSTGAPIQVTTTSLTSRMSRVGSLRSLLWHGRDPAGRAAGITAIAPGRDPYPAGTVLKDWGDPYVHVFPTGPAFSLDIMSKIHEQAEWLGRIEPDYLLTLPTNLLALARTGVALPRLRQVMTIGEVLEPEVRAACREAWGVPVVDTYSAREVGRIAVQCPLHEHYHVQSEAIRVEIVDEVGAPCAPGQVGDVALTSLHNFAQPLIRYKIGDRAEAGAPCPCGRGLPVLTRILGRLRDMVRLPNGEQHYPSYQRLYEGFATIRQFQIVRTAVEALEMKLVATAPLSRPQEEELARRVRERFQYPFAVTFSYHAEIPRGPGGKFRDYVAEF